MVFAFTMVVNAAEPTTYQTANLTVFMSPTPTAGAATLFRTMQSAELRVTSGDLLPDTSYSVWWVIFNNPSACVGPCNGPDLAIPAVRGAVFYAAGFVTGSGTTGYAAAHVDAGALPNGIDIETGSGLDPGNGFRAEIHVVIRSHGSTTLGVVDQQIGSFNGACQPTPTSCANVRAAQFPPVQ
jgi:hypothetical protein